MTNITTCDPVRLSLCQTHLPCCSKNLCKTTAHYRIRSVTWRYRQVKQFQNYTGYYADKRKEKRLITLIF